MKFMQEPDIYKSLRQFRRILDRTVAVLDYLLDNGDLDGSSTPEEIRGYVDLWAEINAAVGNHLASDEPMKGMKQMANVKGKIYNTFAAMNCSFDTITDALRSLHEEKVISAEYLKQQTEITEELRAGINHYIVNKREETEAADWYRFGQMRETTEKKLSSEQAIEGLPQAADKDES